MIIKTLSLICFTAVLIVFHGGKWYEKQVLRNVRYPVSYHSGRYGLEQ